MYLDSGSDAESVVGQAEPMDGKAEEMVDQGGPVRGQPVRERRPPDMYGEWVICHRTTQNHILCVKRWPVLTRVSGMKP